MEKKFANFALCSAIFEPTLLCAEQILLGTKPIFGSKYGFFLIFKKNLSKFCQFCLMLSKSPGDKQVLSNKKGISVAAIQVLGLASCLFGWVLLQLKEKGN